MIAYVFLTIGLVFMGPSQIFHLPKVDFFMLFIGLFLNGVVQPLCFAQAIPEALEITYL